MTRITQAAPVQHVLAWWESRTLRERRMLGIMAVLVLAVLAWLLIVRPAMAWRETAARDRALAEARLETVQRAVQMRYSTPDSAGALDLQAVVAEASTATGLNPILGMSPEGGLGFSLSNVSTSAGFGWLAALKDRNIDAIDLSVVENTDATLSLEGTLAPAS